MLNTTIGKKVVVALTGLVLFGFVMGHLVGNLLIFLGPDMYNHYSASIKANVLLLWGVRAILLGSVVLHVVYTIQLTRQNRASRPVPYEQFKPQRANFASMIMIWSGVLLLSFIIFHLLHFTTGTVHPQFSPHDVYSNVIIGFQSKPAVFFYILAMISLGFHLYHGVWSLFQTLGLNHEKYNCYRRMFAVGVSTLISAGFISIPTAVLLGILH